MFIKFGFACLTVTIHFVFNSYSNYIKIAQKSQSFVLFFIHIFYFLFIFVKLSRNGRKCSLTHCRRDPGRGNLFTSHPGSKNHIISVSLIMPKYHRSQQHRCGTAGSTPEPPVSPVQRMPSPQRQLYPPHLQGAGSFSRA